MESDNIKNGSDDSSKEEFPSTQGFSIDKPLEEDAGAPKTSLGHIGPYHLVRTLGEGGMGTVWLAEQTEPIRRQVAIKTIKSGNHDYKQIVGRFEAERQALAMMDHRNIAKVLDAGISDTHGPYFVMEYCKGLHINHFCEKHKLDLKQRLQLFLQVCNAVQHAHQKGVIHRDLKPSNILIVRQGKRAIPKVIDFGLVKAVQPGMKLTDKTILTQMGIGTPKYMSPEQVGSAPNDIDTRADIYALGAILYELLTGVAPIDEESLRKKALDEVFRAIREHEPPRPSHRISDSSSGIGPNDSSLPQSWKNSLRSELDWVVMRALEKDREKRYKTTAAFADDIKQYLAGNPVDARPPSRGYQLKKLVSRNKGLATAVATVTTILFVSLAAVSWFSLATNRALSQAKTENERARQAENKLEDSNKQLQRQATALEAQTQSAIEAAAQAERSRKEAESLNSEAVNRSAQLDYFSAIARWRENQIGEAYKLLWRIPENLRNLEWQLAASDFDTSHATLYGHESLPGPVRFSEDGSKIASSDSDGHVIVWDAQTGKQLSHDKLPSVDQLVVDGGQFRAIRVEKNELQVWSIPAAESIRRIKLGGLTIAKNYVVRVPYSEEGRKKTRLETRHTQTPAIYSFLSTDPRGRFVAVKVTGTVKAAGNIVKVVKIDDDVVMINTDSGSVLWKKKWEWGDPYFTLDRVKLNRTGELLGAPDVGAFRLFSSLSGKLQKPISVPGVRMSGDILGFADDMIHATAIFGNRLVRFNLKTGETNLQQFAPPKKLDGVVRSRISPNGVHMALQQGDAIYIVDLNLGQVTQTLSGHWEKVNDFNFSHDGGWLVSSSRDQTLKIWRIGNVPKTPRVRFLEKPCSAQYSHHLKKLVTLDKFGNLECWDDGLLNSELLVQDRNLKSLLAISQDGTKLAFGCGDHCQIRDIQTLTQFDQLPQSQFEKLAFSPDNTFVTYSRDFDSVSCWSIPQKKVIATVRPMDDSVYSKRYSPCGQYLLIGGGGNFVNYDPQKRFVVLETKDLTEIYSDNISSVGDIQFSPDGLSVAVIRADEIDIYEVGSWKKRTSLGELDASSIRFSPDGARLVSVDRNGSVRIHDVINGQLLGVRKLDSYTNILYFGHDKIVFSAGPYANGSVGVWFLPKTFAARPLNALFGARELTLSPNDQAAFAKDVAGNIVGCSIPSGELLPPEELEWPDNLHAVSRDGRWQVIRHSDENEGTSNVVLVDRQEAEHVLSSHLKWMDVDESYFAGLAEQSEQASNWFAAAFNWAVYLNADPSDPIAYDSFQYAHKLWKVELGDSYLSEESDFVPEIIENALKLKRGDASESDSKTKISN